MKKFFVLTLYFVLLISLTFSIFSFKNLNNTFAETDVEAQEAKLRAELKKIEEEQAQLQASLDKQKGETATFQRDVNILTGQIKQAELQIQKKKLEIQNLSGEINLRSQTVSQLEQKLSKSKLLLAELIRTTDEIDQVSLVEAILSNEKLSDYFLTIDSFNQTQNAMDELMSEIRELIGITEKEKSTLLSKQDAELNAKKEIEGQKTTIASKKSEKDTLLQTSKQAEASYQQVLAEKRAKAAQIRAALFQLRDSAGISFGDALKYANLASQATGVRPAFILAILKQESDLGKNVGTCNRAGDPEGKRWYDIMPGPNSGSWRDDQTIYLRIVKVLGLDKDSTPLSCPWGGGWGGAMGPSQFIPTTWASYEARIASAVGVSTPNPWNPEHAVMATAIYVSDLGAGLQTYTAERTAALKYYAGGNWSLPQNAFYGNSVMQHVETIQKQIDFLKDAE